jgi:hypothetical protein
MGLGPWFRSSTAFCVRARATWRKPSAASIRISRPTGAQSPTKPGATKNGVATPDKPAVVFGGSLSGTSAAAAPSYAVQASAPTFQPQTVDLLV